VSEEVFFRALSVCLLVLAAGTFIVLQFVTAPYGRHVRAGWGPSLAAKAGWIVMEAPASLVFAYCLAAANHRASSAQLLLFAMWQVHYVHRAFVYPLGLRGGDKRMPVAIVGLGFLFNTLNAYLNGRHVYTFSGGYSAWWIWDARFVAGFLLFAVGFYINRRADLTLRRLRALGESGYRIPYGGLYRWVSSPNYLGEIIQWVGWAAATWSVAGLAFALWTIANLAPRARAHHSWYRGQFAEYPPERKALVPGLW
jgi:3-oxo-5-alpha-steroid 4-dehydrogenase 1